MRASLRFRALRAVSVVWGQGLPLCIPLYVCVYLYIHIYTFTPET